MFDADKGFVHFTFANRDTYVKDSLVVLNRQRNLYYELKKKNYKMVVFIDLVDSNYQIICGDSAAVELYERSRGKGMLKKFMDVFADNAETSVQNKSAAYMIPREQKEVFLKILEKMMSSSSETAYVCSIEAMASFQGIPSAQKMFQKQNYENYQRKNLFLIVSDTHLNASLDTLTNLDGIFQSEAFPEIRKMCQKYQNIRLYDRMSQVMPGRVTYLNDMRRGEIRNVLLLSLIKSGNKIAERMERIDDYVEFLWLLIHSGKFMSQMAAKDLELKRVFSVLGKRRFDALKNDLSTDAAYEHMDSLIEMLRRGDMETPLQEKYKFDDTSAEYQQYLYTNASVLENIKLLSVNSGAYPVEEKTRERLIKICKELATPHVISDEKNHEVIDDFIRICLEYVHEADRQKDVDTVQIGVDALYYAICRCERETEAVSSASPDSVVLYKGQELYINSYKLVLECQQSIGEQAKRLEFHRRALEKQITELNNLLHQARKMEQEYPEIKERAKIAHLQNPILDEYRALATECAALDRTKSSTEMNLKMIRMNITEQKNTIAVLLNEVNSMEVSEYSISMYDLPIAADAMQEFVEKSNKLRVANNTYFEKLNSEANEIEHNFVYNLESDLDYMEKMSGDSSNDNLSKMLDEWNPDISQKL